jgi:hypothetical protein
MLCALDGWFETMKDSTTAAPPRLSVGRSGLCSSAAELARSQAEQRTARELRHTEPPC